MDRHRECMAAEEGITAVLLPLQLEVITETCQE